MLQTVQVVDNGVVRNAGKPYQGGYAGPVHRTQAFEQIPLYTLFHSRTCLWFTGSLVTGSRAFVSSGVRCRLLEGRWRLGNEP